jgi:5-methyltetrahydrofolate--homocysteine methyltransferase
LLSPEKNDFVNEIRTEYNKLSKSYLEGKSLVKHISLEQARNNKYRISSEYIPPVPLKTGIQVFNNFSIEEIAKYINWTFFFMAWGMKGKFPELLNDSSQGMEAKKLFDDAQAMLKRIIQEKMLVAKAVVGIFPATSDNEDICVSTNNGKHTLNMLRQQLEKTDTGFNLCLSDFVSDGKAHADYIGTFAVNTGAGLEKWKSHFKENKDEYSAIMISAIADRLAEAFTELIHLKVRKELWGFSEENDVDMQKMLEEKYQGIRPAYGYPACPDHSEKVKLFEILDAEKNIGLTLTENFSMSPVSSVSGLIFSHPESKYFNVGNVDKDQIEDYALRKGISKSEAEKLLIHL